MRTLVLAGAAVLALGLTAPARAADVTSAYTDINLDDCLVMESDDFGTMWACPGYKGMPMYVAEGDLRFMVSFGFGADKERAAEQTLPPFNTLGAKVEWRLSNAGGAWRPFAAIVRYHLDNSEGGKDGQVLAVIRLEPGATCQVALIDARANSNANELAQQVADERARGFDCAREPEIVGKFAAWER